MGRKKAKAGATEPRPNAIKLSWNVIANEVKQSLFSAEIASSLTLLAMTSIHELNAIKPAREERLRTSEGGLQVVD